MAVNAGGVYVDLGLNSARFQEGLKVAGKQLDKFGKESGRVGGVIRGAFAGIGDGLKLGLAGLGVGGLFAGARTAAADLAQLNAEAQKAGVQVEKFQELGYAAQGALVGLDAMADGLKELQLRADEFVVSGAGSAAEAFQRLGYNVADLKEKLADPSDLFEEIIEKLGRLDKASQIRVSDELFGGSGGEQFLRLIDQGSGYIAKMRQEARDTGNVIDTELIQRAVEIDRAFAKLSTTIGTNLKGALVSVVALMRDFSDMLNATEAQSNSTLQRRIDLLKAAADNMQKSTPAFVMGGGQQGIDRRLAEAAELQKLLDGKPQRVTINPTGGMGDLSKVKTPAGDAAERLAKAYDQIVLSAEQRITQMGVEQQALGLTTGAAESLRVKQELINELTRAGIKLTPEYAAKIDELAARSGQAAEALEKQAASQAALVDSMDEIRGTAYDVLGGFVSDIRNGVSAADALSNALNSVLDKIIEIGLQQALTGLLGAPGTAGGGFLSSILGGGAKLPGLADGGYTGPAGFSIEGKLQ
ncbi:hypothetical protein [Ancylobacter vacuolatus]|uniref:Plasmid maintenance system antidote protein VapI n=1 Tax=Ancylobacter vacuolatus TaxID=223389 RepID=A0ABU0DLV5_9HYPH|nr:hypothetical protein [Ancylobacter vacuolatus]MDQ0349394.1 plasmid maintenance system antidote protein VapI [Ancylobacter vacuolatus]